MTWPASSPRPADYLPKPDLVIEAALETVKPGVHRFLQVDRRMSARPVMIITADAAWCEQVCRFLELRGHSAIAASTKQAALQTLAEGHAPSVVLADPETADRTFCRLLSARPELRDSRVFLVSAAPARGVYEKGAGISGYVRKAVALDYLMILVQDKADTSHSGGGTSRGRAA